MIVNNKFFVTHIRIWYDIESIPANLLLRYSSISIENLHYIEVVNKLIANSPLQGIDKNNATTFISRNVSKT